MIDSHDDPSASKAGGDSDRFFAEVYSELRAIARARMRNERAGHSLQATDLVHEAYLRLRKDELRKGGAVEWQSRGQFFTAAAEAMRRILIERARARLRIKRGGDAAGSPVRKVALDIREAAQLADERDPEAILSLDRAIDHLGEQEPRLMEIVKLRFYAGLNVDEAAEALGVSPRTIKRDWSFARAWLFDQLKSDAGSESRPGGAGAEDA
jgi:RNA polymerase sigma factor (TIGR02999 family)